MLCSLRIVSASSLYITLLRSGRQRSLVVRAKPEEVRATLVLFLG